MYFFKRHKIFKFMISVYNTQPMIKINVLEMLDAYGKIIKPGVYVKYYS